MTDPVRLYNPNPDAPNVWGAPPTKRNPLAETLANIPSPFDVFSPPPEARKAYGSLAQAVVDMTSPAAVRDTVDASGQTVNALREGRGWDAAGGAASMLTAAAGVVPGGRLITKGAKELAQPIRAYHGSPHDFDKFDISKIGTGEGAQAYGHGLYFAENEGVARGYKNTLSPTIQTKSPLDHIETRTAQTAMNFGGGADGAVEWINKNRGVVPALTDNVADSVIAKIKSGEIKPGGHMYEVNIHADPNRFLDWDKPLSGQTQMLDMLSKSRSPKVQEILNDPKLTAPTRELYGHDLGPMTGEDLYKRISIAADGRVVGPGATPMIAKTGIPGIRYLDGGSRSSGTGSSNYVAFDDKLIEILRKYGLLPVAAGTAVAGASLPQDGGDY